jgi:hypothetical protein
MPVGKIDRRETSLCWVHGSSELGCSSREFRAGERRDEQAFHDVLASLVMPTFLPKYRMAPRTMTISSNDR